MPELFFLESILVSLKKIFLKNQHLELYTVLEIQFIERVINKAINCRSPTVTKRHHFELESSQQAMKGGLPFIPLLNSYPVLSLPRPSLVKDLPLCQMG